MNAKELKFIPVNGNPRQEAREREIARNRRHTREIREQFEFTVIALIVSAFVAFASAAVTYTYVIKNQVISQETEGEYIVTIMGEQYSYLTTETVEAEWNE
jgi:hypothetical protein